MSEDQPKKDWEQIRKNSEAEESQAEQTPEEELMDEVDHPESGEHTLGHPSYAELEEKLTLAEQKAHENWEKSMRAMAELDNVRRRATKDIENAHRFGLEKFIDALLPVVDSLDQALLLAEKEENTSMYEGLELTMKLILDVLTKHDVEQLNPEGEAFDPQVHEAMSMQPSDEVKPNTVLNVFQKGYTLNGRVIRPARVIVSTKAS